MCGRQNRSLELRVHTLTYFGSKEIALANREKKSVINIEVHELPAFSQEKPVPASLKAYPCSSSLILAYARLHHNVGSNGLISKACV